MFACKLPSLQSQQMRQSTIGNRYATRQQAQGTIANNFSRRSRCLLDMGAEVAQRCNKRMDLRERHGEKTNEREMTQVYGKNLRTMTNFCNESDTRAAFQSIETRLDKL